MTDTPPPWSVELAELWRRADTLRATGPMPDPLSRADGEANYARLREAARTLFEATLVAYRDLCPGDYPLIDDNGIPSTGGAIGIRFDEHHSFFFAFERVKTRARKNDQDERFRQTSTASVVPRKRMPGDPLPDVDPTEPVRLAMIALRYGEHSGWQETHRALDPRWDERLLREHLAAYLVGVGYDLTVAARAARSISESR
jgi:hypothetical protein